MTPTSVLVSLRRVLSVAAVWAAMAVAASAQQAGNVDQNFDPGVGPSYPVYATAVQPDGKIIIGGSFYYLDGYIVNGFARLNADGSLDMSFNPRNGANQRILTVALQSDGKVLIGGAFTSINGVYRSGIARLNADGSLDASFGAYPGGIYAGANDVVRSIAVQPDGQILVGGDFTKFNNYFYNHIIRLNKADGSIDGSFDPGYGASAQVGSIVLQPNGKILVGGNFFYFDYYSSNDYYPANGIIRLNADGSVDTSFRTPYPNNYTNTVSLQADGKILLGGAFTVVGNASHRGVARLNADGSVDSSFASPAGGPNGPVLAIGYQGDGKILIGGNFTGVDGIQGGSIARLQPNGVLDPSYGPIFPANGPVGSIQVLGNGQTLAAGAFTFIGGINRPFIARLYQDATANPTNVKYLRLLSLGDSQFTTDSTVSLCAEAYSPGDPVVSLQLLNNDAVVSHAAVSSQPSPVTRKAANVGPVRHGTSIFQQVFNALSASLSSGVNNLKVVATTQSGATLTSNTSGISGGAGSTPPDAQITNPVTNSALPAAGSPVQVMVTNAANPVTVDFYVDSAKQDFSVAGNGQSTFTMPDLATDRPHFLSVVVTDNVTRVSKQSAAVTVTPPASTPGLPTVTLTATRNAIVAGQGINGIYLITRDGDTSQDLTVSFTPKGAAIPDQDYKALSGTKIIKAGQTSVKVKVKPIGVGTPGVTKAVALKLNASDAYTVGTTGKVKVKITGQ